MKNAGSGFVYQENVQSDALQNITYAEKNNGTLFESRTYDQVSGQLKQLSAASAASAVKVTLAMQDPTRC